MNNFVYIETFFVNSIMIALKFLINIMKIVFVYDRHIISFGGYIALLCRPPFNLANICLCFIMIRINYEFEYDLHESML